MSDNVIQEKSFRFAIRIIGLYRGLKDQNEYVISRQLLRSGTSIGANVEEAISAQSRKDFISKMTIATKEARECRYWLRLLEESGLVKVHVSDELSGVDELLRILTSITLTAKKTL